MHSLIQFFKQPFPYFHQKWQIVLLVALAVAVELTIVMSFFIMNDAGSGNALMVIMNITGYTIVSALCTAVVVYIFPLFFKRFFNEKQWTRAKYFVFAFILILIISVANTLYGYFFLRLFFDTNAIEELSFRTHLYIFFITTILIGIIPTTLGYFWLKNQGLHSDLHEKEDQNQKLIFQLRKENAFDDKIITLSGNTKDSLTLFPHELLYMESAGNYVCVHYQANGQISQKTLRTTLQQMEELLVEYPFFVRCHRAFIVNTHRIEKIKGSKLWLHLMETPIPVSKTYKEAFLIACR